jgi:hypothetical protein
MIKKIPIPGGSGKAPTGALQFEDDWPGLFVRGDDAGMLMIEIDQLLAFAREKKAPVMTRTLKQVRDIIANDVIVKRA